MLTGETLTKAALLLFFVKTIIWSVALGSGTSGGILAPLLIIGGTMGVVLGGFLPTADTGFWALLAMAATMGGTMRAPLTATFFAVELTGNTHVLVPLITACSAAHVVTVLLMKRSILTEKIARRGLHLVREYRVDPFALPRVSEVMTTKVETVPSSMTLYGAAAYMTAPETHHPSFPVVDAEGGRQAVHPGVAGAERDVGGLGGDHVEHGHRLGEVHGVVEPEALVVARLELHVIGVGGLGPFRPRGHLHRTRQGEALCL